eukprot:TRINITY_DN121464_c0_g1_i1.p1 TRINITY_DN121464_c0_g1~~TRINITY_DN121464_c0_g1_i1.p1  ORF type:complete len:549 (+),score=126.48 TRINITY_DN121464_c0_g1_i1:147-1793(+)
MLSARRALRRASQSSVRHLQTLPNISKPEVSQNSQQYAARPAIDGAKTLIGGDVRSWTGETAPVYAPLFVAETGEQIQLGRQALLGSMESLEACDAAAKAWQQGQGRWPGLPLRERVAAIRRLVDRLRSIREQIVSAIQWEICKNDGDAAKEFDRTMDFIEALIDSAEARTRTGLRHEEGVFAAVRRAPVGVMLNLGPSNYPFNETYATLIPALLMGNTVVMKIPRVGGLAHFLTMEAYAECFPPGVVNFISGFGRSTAPPIMKTGKVDLLAFIGSSQAADELLFQHPSRHRLRTLLSLDAKNVAIILPDADLDVAVKECVVGSTSYNGQRCTALKLIFVHDSVAAEFNAKFGQAISALAAGPPFGSCPITPLLSSRSEYLTGLIEDAEMKGAKVINEGGGQVDRSLFFPAVLYPVCQSMSVYHEEQFGPVIPIVPYKSNDEIYSYFQKAAFGQQASVFTSADAAASQSAELSQLLDVCALSTCRVNINTQCSRGPDSYPFAGRRSSALGTMGVNEVLDAVSVETMVASKQEAALGRARAASAIFAPE